jgi:hypothetical protein
MLRTLPVPATHPNHPAAPAILNSLKDAQRAYAETRGKWAVKALDAGGRRVVDRADNDDGIAVGRMLGDWIGSIIGLMEVARIYQLSRPDTHHSPGRVHEPHSTGSPERPEPTRAGFCSTRHRPH